MDERNLLILGKYKGRYDDLLRRCCDLKWHLDINPNKIKVELLKRKLEVRMINKENYDPESIDRIFKYIKK